MDLELAGKVALVTGASAGIGREIARVLAAEGVQTVVLARRGERLAALQDEIEKAGGKRPLAITADLYDRQVPQQARDQVKQHFGYIDILVNNAGAGSLGAHTPLDESDNFWDQSLAINFTAARKMTHAFLPMMKARKWGRIVNITGNLEPPHESTSSFAKAGAMAWAKGLSRDVGKYGITVNCVVPGSIHSEQTDTRIFPTPESQAEFARVHVPLGFFGEPRDVANMVVFLCTPLARFTTGERIHVDGGRHRGV
jgi:3-oxoacyl-[acyl-carrier protein] reductase